MSHYDRSYLKTQIETTESDIRGADSDTLKVLDDKIDLLPASTGTVTFNATALASVNAEVDTALNTAIPGTNTTDSVNDILLDQLKPRLPLSGTISTGTPGDATAAELAKVPKSDSTVTWNATALAAINAEVDTALNTIVPASPTAGSINDFLSKAAGGNTFVKATDSAEMLSDKIGAFTGDGGVDADDSAKAILDLIKTKTDTIAASPVSTASATTTGVIVEDGATGTPNIVAVTSSASANTFGAWAEIDASASANSWICTISIYQTTNTVATKKVIEIGTGAGGAEATKIRESFCLYRTAAASDLMYPVILVLPIPIKVASGVRIAARMADETASAVACDVSVPMYQTLET